MLPTRFPTSRTDDAGPEPLLPGASRAVLSEFVATAVFVFAAEGSVYGLWKMYTDTGTLGGLLVVAIAHALALAAAVALSCDASGGHVNPAVTFGVLVARRISFARAVLYWAAQLLGAVLAAALLRLVSGGVVIQLFYSATHILVFLRLPNKWSASNVETSPRSPRLTFACGTCHVVQRPMGFTLGGGIHERHALLLEVVMTFGLMYTVYATTVDRSRDGSGNVSAIAPIAIGFVLGANILAGGPFDGAAMNPARAFGPALVGWSWRHHWVYWVGPLIGAGLAGALYESVMAEQPEAPTAAATRLLVPEPEPEPDEDY
uniref:Uncharacterized protein n=1 Tax=Avena sativa TaxID=4498 RepID=A0ACD5V4A8_AVESA